jgi:PAS domain S-box-containing protein
MATKRQPVKHHAGKSRPLVKAASNDALAYDHHRLANELEVHQIEHELQSRALRDEGLALEVSRARYAELYDYAPVGHVTLDRDGLIKELNLAAAAALGAARRELVDRPLRVLLTSKSRPAFDAHLRAVFRARHAASVELAIRSADGEARTIELVSVPPRAAPGSLGGDVAVFHSAMIDVSQRKRDERRREELEEMLRREHEGRLVAETMNRVKQDFLAVVSHELRSPLGPMLMWVRALRAGGLSEALRKRAIDAIDSCLNLQVAMIDDLIDVARSERGTLRIELGRMDLRPVVEGAVEAMAPAAAMKQIEVTLAVGAGPVWIVGEPRRLHQIVANLLTNAITFTPEAGHVALALAEREAEVVLTVRDDGEGIEPARMSAIFEAFPSPEAGAPRHHVGLGVGLAIVHQLVRQHGGRVVAESAGAGRGTCFTVTLPRPPADSIT